jgi:hypothetical protein
MRYRVLISQTAPSHTTAVPTPVCVRGHTTAAPHTPSLRQCGYRESGGVQCEREDRHEGRHDYTDALFLFWQIRYGLVGPVCRTRRGPPEYTYEKGPMCL